MRSPGQRGCSGSEKHADILAQAVALDMAASWQPTVASYLGRVTKDQIVQAVDEALPGAAAQVAHLKKQDMAKAAEGLLAGKGWLPALLRTPQHTAEAEEPSALAAE